MTDRSETAIDQARTEEGPGVDLEEPRVKTYPLNSRQLATGVVKRIAMLEGKLEEQGREPRNIQVQLTEEEGAVRTIELLGAGGAFLQIEVEPEEQDEDGHSEV